MFGFCFLPDGLEFFFKFIDSVVVLTDDAADFLRLCDNYLLFSLALKELLFKFFQFGLVLVGFLGLVTHLVLYLSLVIGQLV